MGADAALIAGVRQRLRAAGVVLPAGRAFVGRYGDSPGLERELLALIRRGHKRATCSLAWEYDAEGEPLPAAGDMEIVVNGAARVELVLHITHARQCRFDAVSARFAALEGEGDGTLEHWREEHWAFFARACERLGRQPSAAMPVLCCEFRLLHDAQQPAR